MALGDVHFPSVDVGAWRLALRVIEELKPTHVVQLGDFADMDAVSAHARRLGTKPDLTAELETVARGWAELEATCRRAGVQELCWCEGNHEDRLARYVARNAAAVETLVPDFPKLARFSQSVWVAEYQRPAQLGNVYYLHDVGHFGKLATFQTLDAVGSNVVFGHTHRACLIWDGNEHERRFGLNAGWLGSTENVHYLPPAKTRVWQHGVAVVDYDGDTGFPQFLPFMGGRTLALGQVVRVLDERRVPAPAVVPRARARARYRPVADGRSRAA